MAKAEKTMPAKASVEITYVPKEGDPATVTWAGIKFQANVPREITSSKLAGKALSNPWFKVSGQKQAAAADMNDPKTAEQYRAYALAWVNAATTSREMTQRWESEAEQRETCGVGTDDLELIGEFYNPKLEKLKKAEAP